MRVGRVDGQFVANPGHSQRERSDLDLVYVGKENDVIMIEGAANELPEEEFIKALEFAQGHVQELVATERSRSQGGEAKAPGAALRGER